VGVSFDTILDTLLRNIVLSTLFRLNFLANFGRISFEISRNPHCWIPPPPKFSHKTSKFLIDLDDFQPYQVIFDNFLGGKATLKFNCASFGNFRRKFSQNWWNRSWLEGLNISKGFYKLQTRLVRIIELPKNNSAYLQL
jgi:hypothetical protein